MRRPRSAGQSITNAVSVSITAPQPCAPVDSDSSRLPRPLDGPRRLARSSHDGQGRLPSSVRDDERLSEHHLHAVLRTREVASEASLYCRDSAEGTYVDCITWYEAMVAWGGIRPPGWEEEDVDTEPAEQRKAGWAL